MVQLDIRPLGYALGAEVRGIDLRQTPSRETLAAIRVAWYDSLVLCFPDQDLGPEELVAFSELFGELDDNRAIPHNRHPDHPKVALVSNKRIGEKPWAGYRNGQNWHSDLSYTDRPATGTFLHCKERPDVGGDTMFANMYLAYERLSPTMRGIIDDLDAVHDITLVKNLAQREPAVVERMRELNPPVVHPAVRTHPETGRKALFVNERVRNFVGMAPEESAPILDFLNRHAVTPEFVYRHRWNVGDLVLWDNRCTMHIALGDFDMWNQPRHMIRTALLGPKTGRLLIADALGDDATALRDAVAALA
jgi:taurine dioxygenase